MTFHEIEHTSETGFIAESDTLEGVFVESAKALFEVMTDIAGVHRALSRTVRLEAEDTEQLLHAWLEELNFLCQTEREFYSGFGVGFAESSLSAQIYGEPIDASRHEIRSEVKAVTYSDYYLKETDKGWQARVILDI